LLAVEKKCACLGVEGGKNWRRGNAFSKIAIDPQITKFKNTMSPIIKVCAKTGSLKKVWWYQKGNQTPNTKNDRQYNGQKGNQTPNTKNDRQYNGQKKKKKNNTTTNCRQNSKQKT
jgi:hypothetical protein